MLMPQQIVNCRTVEVHLARVLRLEFSLLQINSSRSFKAMRFPQLRGRVVSQLIWSPFVNFGQLAGPGDGSRIACPQIVLPGGLFRRGLGLPFCLTGSHRTLPLRLAELIAYFLRSIRPKDVSVVFQASQVWLKNLLSAWADEDESLSAMVRGLVGLWCECQNIARAINITCSQNTDSPGRMPVQSCS